MKRLIKALLTLLLYGCIFGIITSGTVRSFHRDLQKKRAQYFERESNEIQVAYRAITETYGLTALSFYRELRDKADVLQAIQDAATSDEKQRASLREALRVQIAPSYESFQKQYGALLNIYLPDGTLFLRMYDNAYTEEQQRESRFSIQMATSEQQRLDGFEISDSMPAYRYIAPIVYQEHHIGTAEVGVSLEGLREQLEDQLFKPFIFLFTVDAIESRPFRDRYEQSEISDRYLSEKQDLFLRPMMERFIQQHELQQDIDPHDIHDVQHYIKQKIAPELEKQKAFAIALQPEWLVFDKEDTVMAFLPISDIEGRHVAYLASYRMDRTLDGYSAEFFRKSLTAAAVIFLLLLFIFMLKRSRAKMRQSRDRLQRISDNLYEGLCVLDDNHNISFVNPAAEHLLHYRRKEILGKNLHRILYHQGKEACNPEEGRPCPICQNISRGLAYQSYDHALITKEQNSVPVNLTVSPLLKKDTVEGAIVVFQDITEHKKAENALKESEEYNRLIIETMNEGLAAFDDERRFNYVNSRFCEMFGYSREEVLGQPLDNFLDEKNLRIVREQIAYGLQHQKIVAPYELEFFKKGHGTPVSTIVAPQHIVNAEGNFSGGVVVFTDISNLKRAEKELREAKAFTESILHNVPEVIYSMDREMNLSFMSPNCSQMTGYSAEEFMQDCHLFKHLIHPDDRERLRATRETLIQGDVASGEFRLIKKDGTQIWVHQSATPTLDEKRRLIRMDASLYDISELKHTEQALAEERNLLRTLLDTLPDTIFMKDLSGRYSMVNKAFLKAFEKEREEDLLDKTVFDLLPEREARLISDMEQSILREETELLSEELLLEKDGQAVWLSKTSVPFRNECGELIGLLGMNRNITEAKQAEEVLIDMNIELKETLEDLKRTQSQLIQSEKMAALGQLIAGIAHEINTPLGAIRASIGNISHALQETARTLPPLLAQIPPELQHSFFALTDRASQTKQTRSSREERQMRRELRKTLEDLQIEQADAFADTLVDMGLSDEKIQEFLPLLQHERAEEILQAAYNLVVQHHNSENIITATERASKVVFALKTYAHYDHSGEKTRADVTEGLELVLTLYHNQLKHGVEIVKHYEEVPLVPCYPDELNQVWTNLLHNAVQAMEGHGTLELAVSKQDGHVSVQITDSGNGIPEDVQQKIFEPFFTTKPSGEGSGLGLDIVKKIIDRHHGTLDVTSSPGRTCFSVNLPIGK